MNFLREIIADKNFTANKHFNVKGVINGQSREELSSLKLGLFPLAYNGCGALALYNLANLLGVESTLPEIIYYCDKNSTVLFGLFGNRPKKLASFFLTRGFFVKRAKNIQKGEYSLVTYFCKGLFSGMHIVAVKENNGLNIYNMYGNVDKTYNFKDQTAFMNAVGGHISSIYIIGKEVE